MMLRWLVFNSVGAIGIVIQLSVLFVLIHCLKLSYLPATCLAVEAAVLHNFFWHKRWTWGDRIQANPHSLSWRLSCFHLTNGVLSIAGNLILMGLFVGKLRWNYLQANISAIAICSIFNFLAGDHIVFRNSPAAAKKEK